MTAFLAHILRHPIKSVGYEEIGSALLQEGRVLPFDRHWAISHEAAKFDTPLSGWAKKLNFLRGAAAPALMAVQAKTHDDGSLGLTHPNLPPLRINPNHWADQHALMRWLAPLWPAGRPAPRALEQVAGTALTDMEEPYISILSLSSLAAVSAAAGAEISPHRFRGNLWVEGWQPWAERGLLGKRLRIGGAELDIVMPITRCRATSANPATGQEDMDMLELLSRLNGDTLFGLYALVRRGGEIAQGNRVEIV